MEIPEEREGTAVILRPIGELDATHAPDLEEIVERALGANPKHLLIDLSDVKYISSRGLRAFGLAAKKAKETNVSLAVCSLQKFVAEVFTVSGFDELIAVHESRTSAMRSFETDTEPEDTHDNAR